MYFYTRDILFKTVLLFEIHFYCIFNENELPKLLSFIPHTLTSIKSEQSNTVSLPLRYTLYAISSAYKQTLHTYSPQQKRIKRSQFTAVARKKIS